MRERVMVVKRSRDELVTRLKLEGFFFSDFTMVSEGNYTVEDADWNYKDIPHLRHVHKLAESIPCLIQDDLVSVVVIQKVLCFRFPLSVFVYEPSPNMQIYYTTSFF